MLVIAPWNITYSQSAVDALNYSKMQNFGSARYTAMGGSFGALGGEISGIINNPGGLGIYRNSEFTISTAISTTNTENQYRNNQISDSWTKFNIPNFGYVSSYNGNQNGWKKYSIAFGLNRIANFQNSQRIRGNSSDGSSFIDPYVFELNQNQAAVEDVINYASPYTFGPSQAFNTFAIDYDTTTGQYVRWLNFQDNIAQERSIDTEGRQTETFIAFGGNFQERLFIGASLGIQSIRYDSEQVWSEKYSYDTPPVPGFDDILSYREISNLRTRGTGVNFKLGLIYKLNNAVRVGGSIHSPTYFGMSEEYIMDSQSSFSNGDVIQTELIQSNYDYQFRTPWKFQTSIAYIYGSTLLFNIDYEFQDFSGARFDDNNRFPFDYSFTNDDINTQLQQAHQIRTGVEYRVDPFVLRGGFRYESNPFTNNTFLNPDESRKTYSLGTGFRSKNYNVDISYLLSSFDIIDPVYASSDATATIKQTEHLFTLTFGWKW